MASYLIYNKIQQATGKKISQIEKDLGLGNATIANSIKRKATVDQGMIDKLSKAYPHLDLVQMQIDLLHEQRGGRPDKEQGQVSEPEATYKKQPVEGETFYKMFEVFLHEQREDRRMFMGEITKAEVAILETKKDLFDFKVYTDTRLQTDRLDILIHASELAALRETLIENNQDYLSQTPGKRREAFRTALARHHRAYNIDSIASQSGSKKRSQQAS